MRCYICNRETNSFKKDPDGTYVSICAQCRNAIYEMNRRYDDITEDDLILLKEVDDDC